MKKCLLCNQTYDDESLNFCLNDGGTLTRISDDPPPTMFMNQARQTNENWSKTDPFAPPHTSYSPPPAPWQSQQMNQNPPGFMTANAFRTPNQTLPTVSLVLGIVAMVFCCYGFPFGIGALVTGYFGYNNINKDPQTYGGRGLAIAGMVMGGISILELLIFMFFAILGKTH